MVPDQEWNDFAAKIKSSARQIKNNDLVPLIIIPLAALIYVVCMVVLKNRQMLMVVSIVPLAIMGVLIFLITSRNEQHDDAIRKACKEFADSHREAFSMEYWTKYTGVCKPKGAMAQRCIIVRPPSVPIGGAPTIAVTVPAGSVPGTVMQVQTASGQQVQFTVPPGVKEGQTIQIQVPGAAVQTSPPPVMMEA